MCSRAARHHSAIAYMTLALGVCWSIPLPAQAQVPPRAYQIISAGSVGLAPQQLLRYVWTNLADTDTAGAIGPARRLSVRVIASDGQVIAQSEAPAVGPGEFQWFVFDRDQIPLQGEPGTGRLQVRLEATTIGDLTDPDSVSALLDSFADTAEIVDARTGRTVVSFKPKEIAVVGTSRTSEAAGGNDSVWIDVGGGTVMFMPEQALRVTMLHPFPATSDRDAQGDEIEFTVSILDAGGHVLTRTDEIVLVPGDFQSLDFTSADLLSARDPSTGLLQVRCEIERRYFNGIVARIPQGKFPGVLELIAADTGGTVLLLPAVQTGEGRRSR